MSALLRGTDVAVLPPETSSAGPVDVTPETDFQYARRNIQTVIDIGLRVTEQLGDVAERAQDPKLYDSLTKSIRELVVANRSLIQLKIDHGIAEPKRSADAETDVPGRFVGTTADLLRTMKGRDVEDAEIVE